jgi:hypothetical protein
MKLPKILSGHSGHIGRHWNKKDKAHKDLLQDKRYWIGFDFDSTLAMYHDHPEKLGKPISGVIKIAKSYIKRGITCKVFTARAKDASSAQIKRIQDWTQKYLGKRLAVINEKDPFMIALYDDKAIQVEPNSGKVLGKEPKFLKAFGTHEGAVLGWESRLRGRHPNLKYIRKAHGLPYLKDKTERGKHNVYFLYDKQGQQQLGRFENIAGKEMLFKLAHQMAHPNDPPPSAGTKLPSNHPDDITGAEKRMASSPVTGQKDLGGGINTTQIVTFADGSKGIFKPKDGEYQGAIREGITDHQMERELAAWQVAKIVGMHDLVPASVKRTLGDSVGALMEFRVGKIANNIWEADKQYDGKTDSQRAAMFDYVIGNTDRHGGNWLVNENTGKLSLIDHGLAFSEKAVDFNAVNAKMVKNAGLQYGDETPPADLTKKYVDSKDKILQALKDTDIPQKAIDRVSERIDYLASPAWKPTWRDLKNFRPRAAWN